MRQFQISQSSFLFIPSNQLVFQVKPSFFRFYVEIENSVETVSLVSGSDIHFVSWLRLQEIMNNNPSLFD